MSNLEQAVILMNDRWLGSLGEMEDYLPSKKQIRKVKRIAGKLRGNRYHRLTRRATAALVAAAILLSAFTVAMANETSRNYIIEKFKEYSIYRVEDSHEADVSPIEVGYIPEGFKETYKQESKNLCSLEYSFNNQKLCINKCATDFELYFDTEEREKETITINNIDYVIYNSADNNYGIIWNQNSCNYLIEGNIDKKELIKVAISTK